MGANQPEHVAFSHHRHVFVNIGTLTDADVVDRTVAVLGHLDLHDEGCEEVNVYRSFLLSIMSTVFKRHKSE